MRRHSAVSSTAMVPPMPSPASFDAVPCQPLDLPKVCVPTPMSLVSLIRAHVPETSTTHLRIRLSQSSYEVTGACIGTPRVGNSVNPFSGSCVHDASAGNHSSTGWVLVADIASETDMTLVREQLVSAELAVGEVLDRLILCGPRWWSALCENDQCCPPEGSVISDWPAVGDSASSDSSLAGVDAPSWLAEIGCGSADEITRVADEADACAPLLASAKSYKAKLALINRIDDAVGNGFQEAKDAQPLLIAALDDIRLRDGLLRRWVCESEPERQDEVREALIASSRLCAVDRSHALLTVIAGLMWSRREADVARLCVELALARCAHYSLARLLHRALIHGVPQRVWLQAVEATSMRECLVGSGKARQKA